MGIQVYKNHDKKIEQCLATVAETTNKLWSSSVKPTCAVTFTDDDGHAEFYTLIRPICLAKNCKYTSLYVTGSPNMTDEQLNQLQADGLFEFISHSHVHIAPDERTEADLRADFEASIAWLKARGMNYRGYGAPGGLSNAKTRRIIKEYFNYNLSGYEGYNFPPIHQFDIPRVTLFANAEDTLETYKAYVDNALVKGAWLIFIGHCWQETFNTTILGQLIDYVQSLNIDIINTQEGIERFGNLIDVGDNSLQNDELHECFVVGKNGSSRITSDFVMANDKNVTIDTPITYFPHDRLTCLSIADGSTYPESQGGNLWTYRISHILRNGINKDTNSFQLWFPYFSNRIYKRAWDTNTNAWKTWAKVATDELRGSAISSANAYTTLSTPTNIESIYGSNIEVITPIYSSNSDLANFPEGKPGYLITYNIKVAGSYAYVYQEYKVHDSHNKYTRRWNSIGNVWYAWKWINGNLSLTTAQRQDMSSTWLSAGDVVFDTTLNKPVWRNASNNGWVDATGTTV